MAEKVLKMIIQLRNDTKANFDQVKDTLILRAGECAVITDYTENAAGIVLGDGVKTFGELPVITAGSGSGTGSEIVGDNKTIQIVEGVASLYGFDETKAGMTFKVSEDGTAIEWYAPVTSDSVSEQVSSEVAEQLTTVNENVTNVTNNVTNLTQTVTNLGDEVTNLGDEITTVDGKVTAVETNLTDNYYTKAEVDGKISGAFKYMGTVTTFADLEALESPATGELYQVTDENKMYVYNGTGWDEFGVSIDMSAYVENTAFAPVQTKVNSLPETLISELTVGTKTSTEVPISVKSGSLQESGAYQIVTNSSAIVLSGATSTEAGLMTADDKVKLDGIGAGAQSNLIESLSIAGVQLAVSDKNVDLPMATETSMGLVKSSSEDNKIFVNTDGTMEVKTVTFDRIVEGTNDIVLNGGGAFG